jgi:signal transduction histidine kinase
LLEVKDNGKGMPANGRHDAAAPGVGIAGMRERVRQLRGALEISSEVGKGTKVIASLPYIDPSELTPTIANPVRPTSASKAAQ